MNLLTIEQVDNGYVVTNNPDRGDRDAVCTDEASGIHVFETFASMSKWLEGYFEPDDLPAPKITPLGNNDDF